MQYVLLPKLPNTLPAHQLQVIQLLRLRFVLLQGFLFSSFLTASHFQTRKVNYLHKSKYITSIIYACVSIIYVYISIIYTYISIIYAYIYLYIHYIYACSFGSKHSSLKKTKNKRKKESPCCWEMMPELPL